jgi:1-acyl-sn-glycerol-3-phosphate acyltransferase
MEPVFRTLEITAGLAVRFTGAKITYSGLEHIPAGGGAVLAINHTSYVDFLPAGLAATRRNRRMRFMVKSELQQVKIIDFLIRHTRAVPVDRRAGTDAYAFAVQRLRDGELVGVYPEATISRSFELKRFKSGAARMALEAQVPVIPLIVWGAQRIWTKDHPKRLGRNKIPTTILHRVQREYPHPAGAHWVPRRLGGGAPTPAEADRLDAAELAERARKRAES